MRTETLVYLFICFSGLTRGIACNKGKLGGCIFLVIYFFIYLFFPPFYFVNKTKIEVSKMEKKAQPRETWKRSPWLVLGLFFINSEVGFSSLKLQVEISFVNSSYPGFFWKRKRGTEAEAETYLQRSPLAYLIQMYQKNRIITEEEDKKSRSLYSITRVLGILDKFPKNKKKN